MPRNLPGATAAPRPTRHRDHPEIARFRQDLEVQKRSRYTIKHYCQVVSRFHRWLEAHRGRAVAPLAATDFDLKQYQIQLTTQGRYSKNTLYATIKALHAFYRFAGLPVADAIKPPRRAQGLPKYLSESEASRLRHGGKSPRDRAILSLLLYGGFRVGELCRIQIANIDFQEQTVRIQSGKGDKDRLVIVSPRCLEDVRAWLEERPASAEDYLFPGQSGRRHMADRSAQRIVSRIARDLGLPKKVTPHVLRHTLATTLLRRGGDIRFIQRILGHASIATTQVYTHLDDGELRRMYTKASPQF